MTAPTLGRGKPLQGKYQYIGIKGRTMVPAPTQLLGIILSRSGAGKTYFGLSCPYAYIINTDISSTTFRQPKAWVWPGVSEDGTPIQEGPSGDERVDLTFETILERINLLEQMGIEQVEGRPRLVIIDTLATYVSLLKDYIRRTARQRGLWKSEVPPTAWRFLGQGGWDELPSEFMATIGRLRKAGYGVYVFDHLAPKTTAKVVKSDNGPDEISYETQWIRSGGTPKLYSLLWQEAELVCILEEYTGRREVRLPAVTDKNTGAIIEKEKTRMESVHGKRRMVFQVYSDEHKEMKGLLKPRIGCKDPVDLPEDDPWGAFEEHYLKHANIEEPSTPQPSEGTES